jgi:hypothetical protein
VCGWCMGGAWLVYLWGVDSVWVVVGGVWVKAYLKVA